VLIVPEVTTAIYRGYQTGLIVRRSFISSVKNAINSGNRRYRNYGQFYRCWEWNYGKYSIRATLEAFYQSSCCLWWRAYNSRNQFKQTELLFCVKTNLCYSSWMLFVIT